MARAYHENVIDHYANPRNVGPMDKNVSRAGIVADHCRPQDKNVGTGLVGAPACGDVMKLQIKVNDETGEIEKAVFKVRSGCACAHRSADFRMWVGHREQFSGHRVG